MEAPGIGRVLEAVARRVPKTLQDFAERRDSTKMPEDVGSVGLSIDGVPSALPRIRFGRAPSPKSSHEGLAGLMCQRSPGSHIMTHICGEAHI